MGWPSWSERGEKKKQTNYAVTVYVVKYSCINTNVDDILVGALRGCGLDLHN